ncbi:MAG TPA: GNAT family N-acetyltransferase [Ramlibacter sp.]|nr:GNAT family N-acetyltransferase [Ramlibacter sp.]
MNVHIRQATEDDLPAVLALYAQPGLDDGDVLSLDDARRVFAEFARYPKYRLFVACEGTAQGPVIASYALLVMHNLAHRGAPSAVAEDVVVAFDRHGLGIGRRLMAHAMEQAREAGCYKLALSSNRTRADAHAFYESLGFAQHGLSFAIGVPQ